MGQPRSFRSRSTAGPITRQPTDTTSKRPELKALLMHLACERGLADNSLHAYRRDLEDLDRHLALSGKNFLTATADDFRLYLQHQTRLGKRTRTVSRRLAAIRVLLRFLNGEGHDQTQFLQKLER